MRRLTLALAVLGATTILVLAANTVTLAATGQGFLLGKSNSANTYTSLTRTTSGTVLKLQSLSASNPPLTVNGTGRVTNLNADRLDGLDSSTLRTSTRVFTSTFTDQSEVAYNLPLANGTYLITFSSSFAGIGTAAVECAVSEIPTSGDPGRTVVHEGQTYSPSESSHAALSGAGTATKSADQNVFVSCRTDTGTWSNNANNPLIITATPTTLVSEQTITPLVP